MNENSLFISYVIIIGLYFFPFFIALGKRHHNTEAIGALNLLLGWTVLGWVGAFVWACTAVRPVERTTA